jgi:hypothetical protein
MLYFTLVEGRQKKEFSRSAKKKTVRRCYTVYAFVGKADNAKEKICCEKDGQEMLYLTLAEGRQKQVADHLRKRQSQELLYLPLVEGRR